MQVRRWMYVVAVVTAISAGCGNVSQNDPDGGAISADAGTSDAAPVPDAGDPPDAGSAAGVPANNEMTSGSGRVRGAGRPISEVNDVDGTVSDSNTYGTINGTADNYGGSERVRTRPVSMTVVWIMRVK